MDFVSRKNEENLKISREIEKYELFSTTPKLNNNSQYNFEYNSGILNLDHASINHNKIYNKNSKIQDFYEHKNVFITGGTGFLGKILIEKLIRACDLENIYLLVRPKKGKDIHTRIEEICDDPIFDTVRAKVPKFRHKIVAISGDCAMAGLGLSLDDRQLLINNCHVVFHAGKWKIFLK
jgi:FlaA1/EpsC-like NDP-sugar epimerase